MSPFEAMIGPVFEHGCALVADGNAGYLQPTVLAFGPNGEKAANRSFGLGDLDRDLGQAVEHIAANGRGWGGYMLLHSSVLGSGGKQFWAVVLEAVLDGHDPLCLVRRYEIDEQHAVRFVDQAPIATNAPPDRRRN